jgi:hypothetical protein
VSARIGIASTGNTPPTAVANANADAEWPDGKEPLPGTLPRRESESPLGSGRRRRAIGFSTRLATKEATPTEARPLTAARRPDEPRVAARIAAEANQSRE